MTDTPAGLRALVEEIYRAESRRVFASLVRLVRDFDLAEEALGEAFAAAVERWGREGVPESPRAWLVSTGRFKAIDALRRRGAFAARQREVAERFAEVAAANAARAGEEIEDDRLRLIFACCHPALDLKVQVPLTLREVCGLTAEEIAGAFLTTPATLAQRVVRGKAKIRDAGVPFVIPPAEELPQRLGAVPAAGVPDPGYGAGGWAISPSFGHSDCSRAMALEPDGRLVEAGYGYTSSSTPQVIELVRFLGSAPPVGSFTASPNPVTSGSSTTLTASNISDGNPNSTITQVAFYYLDGTGTQQVLGYGTVDGLGNWALSFTVNLAPGTYTLYAQAEDGYGAFGDPLALTLTVQ
jgi:RNA polymerase sigma factor (sigma-70 family)